MLSQVSGERSYVAYKSSETIQYTTDCSGNKSCANTTLHYTTVLSGTVGRVDREMHCVLVGAPYTILTHP
jgi:hypothetical protein